jgi:hypothetical protein
MKNYTPELPCLDLMPTIVTDYLGITYRGKTKTNAHIRARTAMGELLVSPIDHSKSDIENHRRAAQRLARKRGLRGTIYTGQGLDAGELVHVVVLHSWGTGR